MAGDNLTIQIGGDSSKLRADLKFTQTALKDLDRQISAAFKSGDTARARDLSNTFGKMKDEAVNLERSLRGVGATGSRAFNEITQAATRADASVNVTARSTSRLFKQLQSVPRAFGIGGTLLGGGIGGAVGAGVGIGISKLIEQFEDLAKSMRDIRDLARESTAQPLMVQGFQELAKEAGESEDKAKKFLSGVSSTIQQVATTTQTATDQAAQSFATFGDKTIQVMRGAEQAVRDFSKPLDILQVDQAKLKKLPYADQVKMLGDALLRTAANAKQLQLSEIQLNEISKDVTGLPLEDAKIMIKAFSDRAAREKELADSARGATAQRLEDLKKLEVAGAKAETAQKETWAVVGNAILGARLKLNEFIVDVNKMTQAWMQGKIEIQQAPSSADQIQTDFKDLPPFFETLGKTIGEFWKKTFSPSGLADPSIPAMPVEATTAEFDKLPPYFEGLTKTIGDVWKGFWGLFISEAKAATLDVQGGMAAIKASADQATASIKQMGAGADYGGGGDTASGGASGVSVKRGPGTGPTGGYGPASFNQSTGYGPGSFPTQSILPGVSDYQALPPHMVSPMATSSYGSQAAKSAAEASADAAYASRTAAEASAKAVNAWVDPGVKFAAGGMVHGPGTATSDSILARLSRGEFVMRAAAVNRVGAGFLSRLNGFADGGMVMPSRSIPSFASGGLVSGGVGGATVNLVFPGGSFELRADSETVGALTREARRAGMLNAGRLPGAFA